MSFRWNILDRNHAAPVLSRLRKYRKLDDFTEELHDPFLLPQMDMAVERTITALRRREKILVFGDYDADGITGTALILDFLRTVDADYDYMLPHRLHDGYGLHSHLVEEVVKRGTRLLITVDNGTTAHTALEELARHGVDVIVLDHHTVSDELPKAVAIVNPKMPGSPYPFKDLAAVGVAFKFLQALDVPLLESYLDLVSIGTIGDMVPLLGENRLLVKKGLERINYDPRPGIRALIIISNLQDRRIRARNVGWMLAPRINSAGRMESPDIALNVLRATSLDTAMPLAKKLARLNQDRREEMQTGLDEVLGEILEQDSIANIIQKVGDWHLGIIGLISGRVTQEYSRPSIIFSRMPGNGVLKASGRSIAGFDITNAISLCGDLLVEYGGHKEAAGLTIREENLAEFNSRIEEFAAQEIQDHMVIPELTVDCELARREINLKLIDELSTMEPFGIGNREPMFALLSSQIMRITLLKDGKHLKLHLKNEEEVFEALWWNHGHKATDLKYGDWVDTIFQLQSNNFGGHTRAQLIVQDLRLESEHSAN